MNVSRSPGRVLPEEILDGGAWVEIHEWLKSLAAEEGDRSGVVAHRRWRAVE